MTVLASPLSQLRGRSKLNSREDKNKKKNSNNSSLADMLTNTVDGQNAADHSAKATTATRPGSARSGRRDRRNRTGSETGIPLPPGSYGVHKAGDGTLLMEKKSDKRARSQQVKKRPQHNARDDVDGHSDVDGHDAVDLEDNADAEEGDSVGSGEARCGVGGFGMCIFIT